MCHNLEGGMVQLVDHSPLWWMFFMDLNGYEEVQFEDACKRLSIPKHCITILRVPTARSVFPWRLFHEFLV